MSTPASRLSQYRSYSYYHILAICNSATAADELASSSDPLTWERVTTSASEHSQSSLGKYNPRVLPSGGQYVILIHGARDADFSITEAKWTSTTAGDAVPNAASPSIEIDGSLTVSEPKGVVFLDILVKSCNAMGIDSAQAVCALKTVFVGNGYSEDRGEFTEVISDIPPLNLLLLDVEGSFTEQGGQYNISFVSMAHGAARLPQYSRATNSLNFTAGKSLYQTLKIFEDKLNATYATYFDCVYDQIKAANAPNVDSVLKSLRKVKYVIDVDDIYQDKGGTVNYTVSDQTSLFKNGANCADPAQISSPAQSSIESVIDVIMRKSPQVLSELAKGDPSSGIKYEYKILSAVHPTGPNDTSGVMCIVYYKVIRFQSPKSLIVNGAFDTLSQSQEQIDKDPTVELINRNTITFDYVYTGKNTDILEFDMKVNMGLAYLQTATLANTFKTQRERAPNKQMLASASGVGTQGNRFGGNSVAVPVFFGSQINWSTLLNTQNASNGIQSAYTLSKHASLECLEAVMKIMGNDRMLSTINSSSSSAKLMNTNPTTLPSTPDADFQDWSHVPSYAKVRVKMPRGNDDIALFTGGSVNGDTGGDYAVDFWFDGYYYVFSIEHTFSDGEFTQTLSMLGIPKKNVFDISARDKEVDIEGRVSKCFDNQIGATTPPSTATVPHDAPSGTQPTNIADAKTVNANAASLSDINGWDSATSEVKAAILAAAGRHGVDQVVLAQVAAFESKFNPTAKNPHPKQTATGLFQFIEDTWKSLVSQGAIRDVPRGTPPEVSLPLRTDPNKCADAGASLIARSVAALGGTTDVGDLYLLHLMGEPIGKQIIELDNAGQGSMLLEQLGTTDKLKSSLKSQIALNPGMPPNIGGIRTWAHIKMASTVKKGMQVAPKVPSTVASSRTAASNLARAQNQKVQQGKNDVNECGKQQPSAETTPRTQATRNMDLSSKK